MVSEMQKLHARGVPWSGMAVLYRIIRCSLCVRSTCCQGGLLSGPCSCLHTELQASDTAAKPAC